MTAGVARKEGQTRLDLAKVNTGIARDIAQNIMKYAKNPLIIVVSNPVDVNTYLIQKETGLPAERVIGTGTSLDTARFRYLLSRRCKVDIRDIQGYILGEHGDSQVPIWSSVNVAGEPIDHFLPADEKEKEEVKKEIATKARTAGADVISLKGATFDGIAMSAFRIVESILKNQNTVLPVAHVLNESYGEMAGSTISLPCVVNDEGIARTLKISMTDEELKDLEHSAKVLKDFIADVVAND